MSDIIKPYGGTLRELLVDEPEAAHLRAESAAFPSLTLRHRQLCDLELLLNGAFSPLDGFMNRSCYESVLEQVKLDDGTVWPIPIVLDVNEETAAGLEAGAVLALRDNEGVMLAALDVDDIWQPDLGREAEQVYGTRSEAHAGVKRLLRDTRPFYVGGKIRGLRLPLHYDFVDARLTPRALRELFGNWGWDRVVAFQTTQPMHRLEQEVTLRAAREAHAHILLHPVVGIARPDDLGYYARVKCYQAIQKHYGHAQVLLSLLPLAMRMAGPREGLWHAIVRRNYGCSHLIVGNDHGSPPAHADTGEPFYPRYAAQDFVGGYEAEIGLGIIHSRRLCYAPRRGQFISCEAAQTQHEPCHSLSASELSSLMAMGQPVPGWFSFPDVLKVLGQVYPPRNQQGFTLFFTGLSGSGKSTLAKILQAKCIEAGERPVTLLDGDIVRQNLSSELGFSQHDRDLNVCRIGFVAGEITKNGGIAICAPIAPFQETRNRVREMIAADGAFIEIYVATPLAVCEERDRKGLYAKARQGLIAEFTGISSPYEAPETPEIRIDTTHLEPQQAADVIFHYLLGEGYLEMAEPEDTLPG